MDYKQTQHKVKQTPLLYLRQMQAFQNMAPQRNEKNSLYHAVKKATA